MKDTGLKVKGKQTNKKIIQVKSIWITKNVNLGFE